MFTSDTLADSAGEILWRALVERAAEVFSTADLSQFHRFCQITHPSFIPALKRVISSTAIRGNAFQPPRVVDSAVVLAGFGLAVAPYDFATARILETPSNDIDTVLNLFRRRKSSVVGYNTCDAPFYVLMTDCVRTLRELAPAHPALREMKILFERTGGSLPPETGRFQPGIALLYRQPGDTISSINLVNEGSLSGSILLYAGWRVDGEPYGAPNRGYVPFPTPLLHAGVTDPSYAFALSRPVVAPSPFH